MRRAGQVTLLLLIGAVVIYAGYYLPSRMLASASGTPTPTVTIPATIIHVLVPVTVSPTPFVPYQATVRAHSWYCYDKPYGDPLPGSLRAGQLVTVIENTGGWAELEADGARPACWVVAAALQ